MGYKECRDDGSPVRPPVVTAVVSGGAGGESHPASANPAVRTSTHLAGDLSSFAMPPPAGSPRIQPNLQAPSGRYRRQGPDCRPRNCTAGGASGLCPARRGLNGQSEFVVAIYVASYSCECVVDEGNTLPRCAIRQSKSTSNLRGPSAVVQSNRVVRRLSKG